MIVLVHVIIALTSIALASFTFFKPSIKRLEISYGLIIATVISGTMLIFVNSADILRTCLSGLLYVTVVSIVTIATHIRVRNAERVELGEDE